MGGIIIGILFISILFLGLSWFYKTYPPKEINWYYGYRTKRSMSNQQVWDAANKHSSESFWRLSIATTVVGLVCIVFKAPFGLFIQLGGLLVGLIASFFATEKYLDKHFDKEGNPKS